MPKRILTLFSALLLILITAAPLSAQMYRTVHERAVVADTHNDVLLRAMTGEDLSVATTNGHSDLVRLKQGGVDVQFFSVWCGDEYGHGRAYRRANAMIDTLGALIARSGGRAHLVRNARELDGALAKGRLAALIGVEGGHMIEDDPSKLDSLAARGMRYLTLTWNNSTTWATSAADEEEKGDSLPFQGLTDLGREIVKRMNRLGVMVDLSHTGERTFWDVLAVTTKPVLVSHSSVYSICPNRRNLKDEQIKAVAKNGGVICVNFYAGFIDSAYEGRVREIRRGNRALVDSVRRSTGDRWRAETVIDSLLAPAYESIRPPLSLLIDHIEYIAKMAGVDHVGLGSDFDGIESLPKEMDDVTFLPNIARELLKRGYTDGEVAKILGGNVVRVFRANAPI
ncbi:MAG: membrane dipeptidase [Bacteroidetes bacterium]|nr:MAG: membrane dipeptidase [Bacteroidota bacterium]